MALQGITSVQTQERTKLNPNGSLGREVVLTITTDLGNIGQLIVPVKTFEGWDNNKLQEQIALKAGMLDRGHILATEE